VAERVLLPVMVNLDAFYVSHALEPVLLPAQELVDAFLPPYAPAHRLDTAKVESWGNVVTQDMFYRHRQALGEAMGEVPAAALEADREWGELTGRSYGLSSATAAKARTPSSWRWAACAAPRATRSMRCAMKA